LFFEIKYAPRMICARNCAEIKNIDDAMGLPAPEATLMKKTIIP
jgi:hypothetical protein